jgi:hypothetical protein
MNTRCIPPAQFACLFALLITAFSLVFCSIPARAAVWGRVYTGIDKDGHLEAILENSKIYVRYGFKDTGTPDKPQPEGMITSFILKSKKVDQSGQALDGAAGRGELVTAYISHEGDDYLSVHLIWSGREAEQEVSIFKDSPYIRIDYISWFINIVDIAGVGGGGDLADNQYAVYGADKWLRKYTIHPNAYFDDVVKDSLLYNPNAPPNLSVSDPPDAGSLNYRGWFILPVVDSANGIGLGRVVPVKDTDAVKLLFYKGFELFPEVWREHDPFTSYLFASTGGAKGALSLGKEIADHGPR